MVNNRFRKGLVFGIIMLFIGASIVPSISGNKKQITTTIIGSTISSRSRDYIRYDDFEDYAIGEAPKSSRGWSTDGITENQYIEACIDPLDPDNVVMKIHGSSADPDKYCSLRQMYFGPPGSYVIHYRIYSPDLSMGVTIYEDITEHGTSGYVNIHRNTARIAWFEGGLPIVHEFDPPIDASTTNWIEEEFTITADEVHLFHDDSIDAVGGFRYPVEIGIESWQIQAFRKVTQDFYIDDFWITEYGENQQPVADFTWTPEFPEPGETVTFDASDSYDPDGYITLYEWDWDNDGNYDESYTTPTATHTWYEEGKYPVTLRVTDNDSATNTITKTVFVYFGNIPPVANFVWTPPFPNPGETVTFDASSSYDPDPDGYIVLYEWDWDNDGTYDESYTTPTATHSWPVPGDYPVTLRVTDNDGATDTITKTVHVIEKLPPVADANGPYTGNVGESILFDASGSYDKDGKIVGYRWDWTNDDSWDTDWSIDPFTTHAYDEEFHGQAKLEVKDNDDRTDTDTVNVDVDVLEPFYFIHITDTHVGTTGGLERFTYIKNYIINLMQPHPKFIVLSGDCTHWGMIPWKNPVYWWSCFANVVQDFKDNGIPVYICMGNHDYFPVLAPDLPDEGDSYVPASNLHLFGLDSGGTVDFIEGWNRLWPLPIYVPIIDWIPEGNGLNQEQIDWLSNHINDYPSYHKVVFMHHPVFCDYGGHNYVNDGFDETIKNGCIMNNRDEFINLCRNNIDIVLGGHIHIAYEYLEGDESSNELPWLNYENDPNSPYYMGYHGAPGWGYWSVSDLKQNNYDLPLYVLTGACSQNLEFRKIMVKGDDLFIWDEWYCYELEDLVEYEMDSWQIILPWKGKESCSFDEENISAVARLHLYDSSGNHVGINETGGVDFEIPDAYYEDEPIFNETTGECINWTDIELINVLCDENESFTFEIEGILNCTLNLTGSFKLGDSGGEINTLYNNVTFYNGSIGRIYINNGTEVHTLFIDDDGDNITDREVQPTDILYPPNKPAKPSGATNGKVGTLYTYSSTTTDPDGDQLYYWFDWGDGNYTGPIGPYNSGETASTEHAWSEKGSYEIRLKAMDVTGRVSDCSVPLVVTMPRNKSFNFNFNLLEWLFERFPNAFPKLRYILGLQ